MADLNASFVQKIFHVTEWERKTNIKHHRQADDLRARFKVPEWGVFCHTARLRNRPPRLKLVLSDDTISNVRLEALAIYFSSACISTAARASSATLPFCSKNIYLPHSLVDIDGVFPENTFDAYHYIFCAGRHHMDDFARVLTDVAVTERLFHLSNLTRCAVLPRFLLWGLFRTCLWRDWIST